VNDTLLFRVFVGVPNASFCEMKSSSIRLFAIDVDGTLLDSKHRLRTDVKDSVCRLAASGLEIALATARGPAAVREIARQFDFSPWLICFSGGWIGELDLPSLQPKDVRLDHRISRAAARTILGAAFSQNVEPNVFTPESWRVRKMTGQILQESRIVNLQPSVVTDLLADGEEPSKIMLISSIDEASDVLRRIRESIRSFSTATFSKTNYLEVLPVGVNKAKALAVLTETLGFELSQVAAIGDAPNDLEMLKAAGLAIAMGNASSEAKALAEWVVGTNDEAGVAQAVQWLLYGNGAV
jgi:Cof subfamily protein (haloacid dehalogenase superfamily)